MTLTAPAACHIGCRPLASATPLATPAISYFGHRDASSHVFPSLRCGRHLLKLHRAFAIHYFHLLQCRTCISS
ncbi:hypothetical protein BT63DRAFT_54923 [Microthyrium microscopicum]|uniref:Uncharacterized protein n=1 Tax=Microthyrium microscopicum TaxID=703497 RepID=A0A6A6U5R7_9PEZI|nr:hypothetical protein BT63DRAFT_54923 [Microthyrium microscopicum]